MLLRCFVVSRNWLKSNKLVYLLQILRIPVALSIVKAFCRHLAENLSIVWYLFDTNDFYPLIVALIILSIFIFLFCARTPKLVSFQFSSCLNVGCMYVCSCVQNAKTMNIGYTSEHFVVPDNREQTWNETSELPRSKQICTNNEPSTWQS